MSKKFKSILQVSVLVIIILAIGCYFYWEAKNKPAQVQNTSITLDQVFNFKVVRTDLSADLVAKYQADFEDQINIIKATPEMFDFAALNHMANLKKIVGDYEGARDAWLYLSAVQPKNSVSFFNLGLLYEENLKDNVKAEENFNMTLQNSAGEAGNEQYYGAIVDFYNNYYPANKQNIEKILLQAVSTEQYKNSTYVLSLLAIYYQNNGEPTKALQYWQKVLKLDPGNKAAKSGIEKLKK